MNKLHVIHTTGLNHAPGRGHEEWTIVGLLTGNSDEEGCEDLSDVLIFNIYDEVERDYPYYGNVPLAPDDAWHKRYRLPTDEMRTYYCQLWLDKQLRDATDALHAAQDEVAAREQQVRTIEAIEF